MVKLIEKSGDRTSDDQLFLKSLTALLEPSQQHMLVRISTLANTASLLASYLDRINWVGFYVRSNIDGEDLLLLGPFWGNPACTRIPVGKGVCGRCCIAKETQLVEDVTKFSGHITCDTASKSELVVPIFVADEVVGVLDIDSPHTSRFSKEDARFIEEVARIIALHW
ncbi:MAG: GAF domain-containing protein [Sphaerochaetaceae bacterium]|jgi:GAF domain-containing protein|nr:GAF domain-containing protein [Sphaerochaetaceae bacterium]NLO60072.1 GAF domain-containing protein [Spirochaetales bacterium]MDD2406198.1 GAF domain-containing protein [Sphaerochaetaceae bacterium]MDD3670912.1 GAF domain-containing protein [Sphaerochaetaceae bacterium]MDD4258518.1 GAF domain-containing protein [Sphaerochaetaceae bacterium]